MKTLLLFRHAKSSWDKAELADHDRPLNHRGQRDAPKMGKLMRENGLLPDLILCSSAVRARQTLELASEALAYHGEIEFRNDLYAFEPGAYLRAIHDIPPENKLVMIVGHNPSIEELISGLTGESLSIPTCALAEIDLALENWKQISFGMRAKLKNLWLPKDIK
jgi:phosphohistidine phosphatase